MLLLGALLVLPLPGMAQQDAALAPAEISYVQDPLLDIPLPQARLAYSLVIDNRRGGVIRIVEPPATFLFNRPGVDLGTVLQPVRRLRTDIPAAGLPSRANVVCYSGTDAVHVKAYDATLHDESAVFSILPSDNVNYLNEEQSLDWTSIPGDALLTDIPAGSGFFGGAYPLIVGNPVNVYRGQYILDFSPLYPDIEVGDRIVIGVHVPLDWPDDLRISNQVDGSVLWNLAGQELTLASCSLPQSAARDSQLPGPLPAAGLAMTSSTSFMIGLPGADNRQCFGVNAVGFGNLAGLQLQSVTELGLPCQAPLFGGYLYPFNPADPPALLPLPVIRLRFGSGSSWVPLSSVLEQQALATVTSLRIDWLPPGTTDESLVIMETPGQLEIGPAK